MCRLAVQCVQAAERPAAEAPAPNQASSHAPARGPATSLAGPPTWMTGLELPRYDRSLGAVELVVAGAGPSGLAVADRVSQAGARSSPCVGLNAWGCSWWVCCATCLKPCARHHAPSLVGVDSISGDLVARCVSCRLCQARGPAAPWYCWRAALCVSDKAERILWSAFCRLELPRCAQRPSSARSEAVPLRLDYKPMTRSTCIFCRQVFLRLN